MKTRKKNLSKKIQNEEDEKKFSDNFEKAEQGDVESMMRILMESGRGYELSSSEIDELFS